MKKSLGQFLSQAQTDGLFRQLAPVSRRNKGQVTIKNRIYFDFSSNDYLGLAHDKTLKKHAEAALEKHGFGATGSRLLSGDSNLIHQLETAIAKFKQKPAALVFNSGYQANIGIISTLYTPQDAIFADRLCHASILDGIKLSGAEIFRFKHNDTAHLETLLKKHRSQAKNALIVTESIFSMDGDCAPLKKLVALKNKYNTWLMTDEAHATGLFGARGSGLCEALNLSAEIELIMGTFSKALGGFGAYLACDETTKDYLINRCRSFIYSTALPHPVIAWNLAAINLVPSLTKKRSHLQKISAHFRSKCQSLGLNVLGETQITPIILGKTNRAVKTAKALQKRGYWVLPIRYPTVPQDAARLRLSLCADHSLKMLDLFIQDLECLI